MGDWDLCETSERGREGGDEWNPRGVCIQVQASSHCVHLVINLMGDLLPQYSENSNHQFTNSSVHMKEKSS